MPTEEKAAAVAELTELFTRSSAAVLTEYRGMSVSEITRLRRSLGEDATYTVAKNTLARIAARNAGVEGLDDHLTGPTAIAFVTGDIAEAAKGLRGFARDTPVLVIKGGVLEGRPIDVAQVSQLADLEPREVLLAKLAGAMKAPLTKAVYLANAPLAQAARAIDALRAKQESATPAADAA
jgi:large subunit ribosomal protein L10